MMKISKRMWFSFLVCSLTTWATPSLAVRHALKDLGNVAGSDKTTQDVIGKMGPAPVMERTLVQFGDWKKGFRSLGGAIGDVVEVTVEVVEETVEKTGKEIGRGAEKLEERGEEVADGVANVVEGTAGVAQGVVEATVGVATLNGNQIREGLDNVEEGVNETGQGIGGIVEGSVGLGLDVAVKLPVKGSAEVIDTITNNDGSLRATVDRFDKQTSKEVRKGSRKVGNALEAAGQPENVGRIALLYVAANTGGPSVAAFANVMYDKLIVGKNMTEEEMLESFAIGATAGHVALYTQGAVEGSSVVDTFRHADYISKVATSVAHTLTTDAGEMLLQNRSYTSRDFAASLVSALSSVELGDDIPSQVVEATLEGGLRTTTTQAVDRDFDVDFDEVELAVYDGFAQGLTREVVHALVDYSGTIEFVEDAASELGDILEEFSKSYETAQREPTPADDPLRNLSDAQKRSLMRQTERDHGDHLKDSAAQNVFGKSYDELSDEDISSEVFKNRYNQELESLVIKMVKNSPDLRAGETAEQQ